MGPLRTTRTLHSVIEEAKSRSLADLIAFRAATLEPHVQGLDSERVGRLRHELNWSYRQLEFEEVNRQKRSPERLTALRQRTTSLESELARSLDALRRTDAEFAVIQSGTADRLEEIRSTLHEGTLLLEYLPGAGRYDVCVVSRDSLEVVALCPAEEVSKRVSLLQFQLLKFRLDPGYIQSFGGQLLTATETHLRALAHGAHCAPIRDGCTPSISSSSRTTFCIRCRFTRWPMTVIDS